MAYNGIGHRLSIPKDLKPTSKAPWSIAINWGETGQFNYIVLGRIKIYSIDIPLMDYLVTTIPRQHIKKNKARDNQSDGDWKGSSTMQSKRMHFDTPNSI